MLAKSARGRVRLALPAQRERDRAAAFPRRAPSLLFARALRYDVNDCFTRLALFGPVYFLSGDGFPADSHCEHELKRRLAPSCARWTGQEEIHVPTPESFPLHDFPRRAQHLETYLAAREHRTDVVLMGRSSGARLATWYASRHRVAGVICIAYPFRNPTLGPEPDRYLHLADLNVPTLICQGIQDDYGGSNIFADYALSSSIRVHLLRTDHNFNISPNAWNTLARIMLEFCQETLRRD